VYVPRVSWRTKTIPDISFLDGCGNNPPPAISLPKIKKLRCGNIQAVVVVAGDNIGGVLERGGFLRVEEWCGAGRAGMNLLAFRERKVSWSHAGEVWGDRGVAVVVGVWLRGV